MVTRRALIPTERGGSAHSVGVSVRHFNERPAHRLQTQIMKPEAVVHSTYVDHLPRDVCYPRHRVLTGFTFERR